MSQASSSTKKWRAFFKAKRQINPPSLSQKQIQKQQKKQQVALSQFENKFGNLQENIKQKAKKQDNNENAVEKKLQLQQTSQDSKSQRCEKKENKQIQKAIQAQKNQQISEETKRILAIFDQKQSLLKFQTLTKNKTQEEYEKQVSTTHIQRKEGQQQSQKIAQAQQTERADIRKCKHAGKHFKIFNPKHFQVSQTQQIKTSIHRWFFGSGQTPQQLLISSWNVNGIRARMANNDILPYLQSLKPDIFCINQHKIDEKSFNQSPIKFWGYHSYWNFPKYSLGYSGVAIFSRHPAKQMFEDIHIPQHSKEGRVITLQFDKFILVHAYIPTCGRQLQRLKYRVQQYDTAFRQYIIQLKSKYQGKTLIICGDLNVAHKDLDCHVGKRMKQGKQPAFTLQQRNSFTKFLKQAQLIDTFRHFYPNTRKYTWWNMRRGGRQRGGQTGIGKRLDYFLVNKESMGYVKSSQIKQQIEGCDHCPIQLKLDFS